LIKKVAVVIKMLYPKLASLRNDHSINLSLSDHVRYFLRENMAIAGFKI